MIPVQQNRYLWVQLVGLATVPLLLDIGLAGLASSRTAFDFPAAFGLQFWAIAAVGILPPLAMQWFRPFYPFSLPPLALKPASLTENQRRNLTLLGSWQIKALSILGGGFSLWLLVQLYGRSAQITPVMTPTAGIVSTTITFFFVCLFVQISLSSVRLLLVGPQTLKRVSPYEAFDIAANFSILGLRVNSILPVPNVQPASPELSQTELSQTEPFQQNDLSTKDTDAAQQDQTDDGMPEKDESPIPVTQPEISEPSETTESPATIENPQAELADEPAEDEEQKEPEEQAENVEEQTITPDVTAELADEPPGDEAGNDSDKADSNGNSISTSAIDKANDNDDFERL